MMSSGGINTQQPPAVPEPARLCPEHAALGLAVASFTASAIALLIEELTTVVVFRGAYSVLAGLFVAGVGGWIVGSAERRVRRDLGEALAGLTRELADLREQVQRQRVTYLPAPERKTSNMYVSAHAEITPPVGIDPVTIAAARRISDRLRQLVDGDR